MQFNAKKIIKKIQVLPSTEKDKVYNFVVLERSKDLSAEARRLIKFGVKSTKKLQDWNKAARQTLAKSKKFTNELESKL